MVWHTSVNRASGFQTAKIDWNLEANKSSFQHFPDFEQPDFGDPLYFGWLHLSQSLFSTFFLCSIISVSNMNLIFVFLFGGFQERNNEKYKLRIESRSINFDASPSTSDEEEDHSLLQQPQQKQKTKVPLQNGLSKSKKLWVPIKVPSKQNAPASTKASSMT